MKQFAADASLGLRQVWVNAWLVGAIVSSLLLAIMSSLRPSVASVAITLALAALAAHCTVFAHLAAVRRLQASLPVIMRILALAIVVAAFNAHAWIAGFTFFCVAILMFITWGVSCSVRFRYGWENRLRRVDTRGWLGTIPVRYVDYMTTVSSPAVRRTSSSTQGA